MKNVVEQWNNAAQKYTEDQEQSEYVESNKQVVKNRFRDLTGLRVLDLGCGYGYYTDYFQRIGADVFGVDGSSNMIEIARRRYPNCSFELCDISKEFSFANERFDLIFCNQVLMDVENIEMVFSEEHGFSLRHVDEPISYDGITKNKDLPLFFFAEYQKV